MKYLLVLLFAFLSINVFAQHNDDLEMAIFKIREASNRPNSAVDTGLPKIQSIQVGNIDKNNKAIMAYRYNMSSGPERKNEYFDFVFDVTKITDVKVEGVGRGNDSSFGSVMVYFADKSVVQNKQVNYEKTEATQVNSIRIYYNGDDKSAGEIIRNGLLKYQASFK